MSKTDMTVLSGLLFAIKIKARILWIGRESAEQEP